MNIRYTNAVSVLLTIFLTTTASAEILFSTGFENWNNGPCTEKVIKENWSAVWVNNAAEKGRVDVVKDNTTAGKIIRVKYPKGGVGPSQCGAQWLKSVPAHEELYAEYRIKFMEDFDPVKGGKLPGLAGKDYPTGGSDVTGSNGFSCRYMWRKDLELVIYCYHMDKPTKWGEDFPLDYTFEKGIWYTLTQRVKMNDEHYGSEKW
jgi:hypothetical protein